MVRSAPGASRRLASSEEPFQHVACDARHMRIGEQGGHPGDGPNRKHGAASGFMMDQVGTSTVAVSPFCKTLNIPWRTGTDLVRFVTGSTAGNTLVQRFLAKEITVAKPGPTHCPVVLIENTIRRRGHRSRIGKHHAQKIGFRLCRPMHPRLVT